MHENDISALDIVLKLTTTNWLKPFTRLGIGN